MSAEREAKIREYRLKQPRAELERKAAKAVERANIWSQEELDAATAEARDLAAYFEAAKAQEEERLMGKSFLEETERLSTKLKRQDADPWHQKLSRVRGMLGDDGIERITTNALLDYLQIPQRTRHNVARRQRIETVMRDLGWYPVRVRSLSHRGLQERVRGWARERPGARKYKDAYVTPFADRVVVEDPE